jgi:hypothetical protein
MAEGDEPKGIPCTGRKTRSAVSAATMQLDVREPAGASASHAIPLASPSSWGGLVDDVNDTLSSDVSAPAGR